MEKETIARKLDSIENILKMLLINSVMNEDSEQALISDIINNIKEQIEPLGLINSRINCIEGRYYIFANLENNNLKRIREIYTSSTEILGDFKLVLVYEKLPTKRKQALEKSEISFCITSSGEIKIY